MFGAAMPSTTTGEYRSTGITIPAMHGSVRRHVEMLTRAGIDFLIFDTTNAAIYEENAKLLIRLLHEARLAGFDAPQIVFYTNTASGKDDRAHL